nr:hypothetical protein [Geothrix sp. 21YS21S-2]
MTTSPGKVSLIDLKSFSSHMDPVPSISHFAETPKAASIPKQAERGKAVLPVSQLVTVPFDRPKAFAKATPVNPRARRKVFRRSLAEPTAAMFKN